MKKWVVSPRRHAEPEEWYEMVSEALVNKSDEKRHKNVSKPSINTIDQETLKHQLEHVSSKPPLDSTQVAKSSTKPACTHCGRTHHSVDRCFKVHGYPKKNKSQKVSENQQVNTLTSTTEIE